MGMIGSSVFWQKMFARRARVKGWALWALPPTTKGGRRVQLVPTTRQPPPGLKTYTDVKLQYLKQQADRDKIQFVGPEERHIVRLFHQGQKDFATRVYLASARTEIIMEPANDVEQPVPDAWCILRKKYGIAIDRLGVYY